MTVYKRITLIAVLLLSVCAGCGRKERSVPMHEVKIYTVQKGKVKEIWTLVGQTVSNPKVELLARVKGFLTKCSFKEGAFVKKGELLFQIEKDQYQALVKQAEAQVAIKQAVLKNATITYNRNVLLIKQNSVSQADVDKATADKDSAIGELDAAKAELEEAKLNLSYTDIISPIDGRIGLTKYNVGNMVGPDRGILALVVSLNPMYVEFSVNEADFLRAQQAAVERGIPLSELIHNLSISLILSNGTDYKETGSICFWNNTINSSTGTILMRASFENPDFILNPGQYVKVQIQSSVPQKKIIIPQVAIQSALGGKFVMTVDKDNIIHTKNITLGYRFDNMVVVKKGLEVGDRIVVDGIQKIRVNDKVKVVESREEESTKLKQIPSIKIPPTSK